MITLTASARYGYGGKQFIARINGRDSKFTFDREFIGKKGGKRNEDSEADVDTPGLYETRDIDSKGRTDDSYFLILEDGERLVKIPIDKADAMQIGKEFDAGRGISRCVKLIPRDAELFKAVQDLKVIAERLQRTFWEGYSPESFITLDNAVGCWKKGDEVRQLLLIEFRTARLEELAAIIAALKAEGKNASDGWELITAAEEKKAEAEAVKQQIEQKATNAVETAFNALKDLPEKELKKALAELKKRLIPAKV